MFETFKREQNDLTEQVLLNSTIETVPTRGPRLKQVLLSLPEKSFMHRLQDINDLLSLQSWFVGEQECVFAWVNQKTSQSVLLISCVYCIQSKFILVNITKLDYCKDNLKSVYELFHYLSIFTAFAVYQGNMCFLNCFNITLFF